MHSQPVLKHYALSRYRTLVDHSPIWPIRSIYLVCPLVCVCDCVCTFARRRVTLVHSFAGQRIDQIPSIRPLASCPVALDVMIINVDLILVRKFGDLCVYVSVCLYVLGQVCLSGQWTVAWWMSTSSSAHEANDTGSKCPLSS